MCFALLFPLIGHLLLAESAVIFAVLQIEVDPAG